MQHVFEINLYQYWLYLVGLGDGLIGGFNTDMYERVKIFLKMKAVLKVDAMMLENVD